MQILSGALRVITCNLAMSPKSNRVFIMPSIQIWFQSARYLAHRKVSCGSQKDPHEKQKNNINMSLFPLLGGGGGGHKKKKCLLSEKLTDWLPATICGVEDCDWPGSLDSLPHEHFTCCSIITCPCTPHIACAACSLLPNLKI